MLYDLMKRLLEMLFQLRNFNEVGKYFFIHNRIENIKEVAGMIQRLVPDAKIAIGHGQIEGKKLEQLMLAFMNGEFDVLVSYYYCRERFGCS